MLSHTLSEADFTAACMGHSCIMCEHYIVTVLSNSVAEYQKINLLLYNLSLSEIAC